MCVCLVEWLGCRIVGGFVLWLSGWMWKYMKGACACVFYSDLCLLWQLRGNVTSYVFIGYTYNVME